MELPQNLWQNFACVASEKKTSSQKWSCHKIYGKCKIFLMAVYLIFKYGKRFRCAPSFNKNILIRYQILQINRLSLIPKYFDIQTARKNKNQDCSMGHTSVNVAGGYSVDLNTDWKEILVGGAIVST